MRTDPGLKKTPDGLAGASGAASTVLLIGASVRALAQSALRSGYVPIGCDLFADWDLTRIAQAHRLNLADYPSGFAPFVQAHGAAAIVYTGGLENYPAVLAQIAEMVPLWGNSGAVVSQVRNPWRLNATLAAAGFAMPRMARDAANLSTDGSWLRKPLAGSCGREICRWRGDENARRKGDSAKHYFQQFAPGMPHSCVYLGRGDGTVLLGVCRQLIGEAFCNAPPFAYCGNIGPVRVNADVQRGLQRIGESLTRVFSLRGLFGLDFVLDGTTIVPLEVNPRYTASVEVLERATGGLAFTAHVSAFTQDRHSAIDVTSNLPRNGLLLDSNRSKASAAALGVSMIIGKCVLYAPTDAVFRFDPAIHAADGSTGSVYADVPHPNTRVRKGDPVLTVFARGEDFAGCLTALRSAIGGAARFLDPA